MVLRIATLSTVLLACAGCAVALTPAEEDSLAEVQAFADATTRAYKVRSVKIALGGEATVIYAEFGVMSVGRATLTAPLAVRDASIALMLGFAVLPEAPPTSAGRAEAANRTRYPERNAAAVDILTNVKGLPIRVAVHEIHESLAALAQAVKNKQVSVSPQVPHPCEQMQAFVRRFARYQLEGAPACR